MGMWLFLSFNDAATDEIYTLSLRDALQISTWSPSPSRSRTRPTNQFSQAARIGTPSGPSLHSQRANLSTSSPVRSEEHTSELQSRQYLVCRLLLENNDVPDTLFGIGFTYFN